jgi:Na+-transporting NADH:ubiquinone oxidoreductase subunit A
MKFMFANKFSKFFALSAIFTSLSLSSFAQQEAAPITDGSLVILLFACVMILVVFLAAVLGDKIIKLVATKMNNANAEHLGIFPSLHEIVPSSSSVEGKKKVVKLTKGFDIKLKGKAKKSLRTFNSDTYAVKPTDFVGLQPIPKMLVQEGDAVKAGQHLFYDKGFDGVFFTAPVSGTIQEIKRGGKRSIAEIVIASDGKFESKSFTKAAPNSLSKEATLHLLADSGALTLFVERPFGLVPNLAHTPKSIHISASDTAPFGVDYNFVLQQLDAADVQAGIDALNNISAQVYLNLGKTSNTPSFVDGLQNVSIQSFVGAHPAGNVGVQIHHTDAIAKGDYVWTIKIEDVATVGKLFTKGIYEPIKYVAVAGSVLKDTFYAKTRLGVNVGGLLQNNFTDSNVRVISGNVLSGKQIAETDYLGYYDNLVSVVEEGNQHEMFGWMVPQYARPSLSPTFPWKGIEFMNFEANTNMHGEKRAFVVSGQYEEVLPMDVYPQYLMKAIIKNDFEEMEGLGIYELLEEDVALCEFACTSKQPLQSILREGLDYIRSQN